MRKATAPNSRSASSTAIASASGSCTVSETDDDQQVVDEGAAEDLVADQLPVVLKADRSCSGRRQAVPVVEAVPGCLADRQDDEEREERQRRRQEDQRGQETAADVVRRPRKRAVVSAMPLAILDQKGKRGPRPSAGVPQAQDS